MRRLIAPRAGFVPFERNALEESIPRRFERQADADASRLALKLGDEAWSYGRLDGAADLIAGAILARSERQPLACVLLMEQSTALVASILGVLKAGAAYVPLETWHPAAHVSTVVQESRAGLILADGPGALLARESAPSVPLLRVDELLAAGGPARRPRLCHTPDAIAYIYYTSGSTGRPKGVADSHRNVLHNVMRYTNSLKIDRDDRLTLLQSPSFSGAVSSLFGALLNGAATFPYDLRRAGAARLGAWVARERITIYHSVPALFRLTAGGADAFPDLRLIRLEGDQMSRSDWQVFRERFRKGCLLVNGLGATECGLIRQYIIDHRTPMVDGVVPIGYPVEDMNVEVVDQSGRPVAVGEVGEIAVRSRYLALGYHERPELTAAAFASSPDGPDLRTYRTGDLGRLHANGCLDHLGRLDARLKLHGQWVDLAEVEAALLSVRGVREAAARVHLGPSDQPRLVGYVVPQDGQAPGMSVLRAQVAAWLPAEAVPAAFVLLARLPLTENGKVDRSALPPPPAARPALDTEFVAPRTVLERAIAAIWTEVLGLDGVGVHDTFFELGGDSLTLIQLHGRLQRQLDAELPLVALFEHPTVHGLARHLQSEPDTPAPLADVRTRADRVAAAARAARNQRPKP